MNMIRLTKFTAFVAFLISLASCKPVGEIFTDSTPPSSTAISINGGDAQTNSLNVTLTLTADGASQMFVTNTAGCNSGGSYESFTTSKNWTLGTSNGTATVYVKFKDRAGNETACSSDSIVQDSTTPTVTSVTSSTPNGSYKAGDSISIQVNFSESVTVIGGPPRLTLETGTTDRAVDYASGSGSTSLTFTYTVQSGDTSSDLDYVATSSLALNGGTIRDAALNNATLTLATPGAANSLGANKALVVDTTAPTITSFSSSTPNGTYNADATINVTATASENVTEGATFEATLNTGATVTLIAASLGTTLSGTYTVAAGQNSSALSVSSFAAGIVLDVAGNQLASTTVPASPNNIADVNDIVIRTSPLITNVTATNNDGTYAAGASIEIQIVFNKSVTVTGAPLLELETGTTDRSATCAAGSGATVNCTYTVQAGDTSADLNYKSTSALTLNGGTIKDTSDSTIDASLTLPWQGVVGAGSLAINRDLVIDPAPAVVNVTSSKADGTYGVGEVIGVQVVFSESVTVTGTPQLILTTSSGTTAVNYTSGSNSTTLLFNYTVAEGDYFSDLDYEATNSLSGTIESAGTPGQNAVLNLASPGAATSLSANKTLRSLFYAAKSGAVDSESFGQVLATGDVNGDGHPDVIVGIPLANSGDGKVIVYSGEPNITFGSTVLMNVSGVSGAGDNFGASVSTADVNDDGKADVIVGIPLFDNGATTDVGKVSVYAYDSGNLSPASIFDIVGTVAEGSLGTAVAGIGDINGDNYDDFIVGIPYVGVVPGGIERGQVKVFSGVDGSVLATLSGNEDNARFGAVLAATGGDVNNDNKPDFIVSAPTADGDGGDGANRGRVRVYSGANFSVLHNYYGTSDNDEWGSSLAGGVDITGDNIPDFAIGSRYVDPSVGAADRGQVIVYNGFTGLAVPGYTYTGSANSEGLGASVDFIGDANSDTRKAFVIGSPNAQVGGTAKGKAVVYDGNDGSTILYTIEGTETGAEFGGKVLGLRDSIENDSRNDFVISAPSLDVGGTDRGQIFVYR